MTPRPRRSSPVPAEVWQTRLARPPPVPRRRRTSTTSIGAIPEELEAAPPRSAMSDSSSDDSLNPFLESLESRQGKRDRRQRRRRAALHWAMASTLDHVLNLAIAFIAFWLLAKATTASAVVAPGVAQAAPAVAATRDKDNVMTSKEAEFLAYDCSAPVNISTVSLDSSPPECNDEALKKKQKAREYLLLQKAERIPIEVQLIDAQYMKMVFVCGGASHSAIAAREWRSDMRYALTVSEAKELWRTKTWNRPVKGKIAAEGKGEWTPVKLKEGGYEHFSWEKVGWSGHGGNDILCQGDTIDSWDLWDIGRKTLTGGILNLAMKVGMFTRKAYWIPPKEAGRLGKIQLERGDVFSCEDQAGGCMTEEGTYTWRVPSLEKACPYYLARETKGIDVKTPDQKEGEEQTMTYLSTDESMVRVEKKGTPLAACGGIVQGTNFDKLYLTTNLENKDFRRTLHPSEASAYLYSDVSDFYIHEKLQDDLERTVLGLQKYECRKDAAVRSKQFARKAAEQQTLVDGGTAHLGQGRFFTARGDGGFLYTCRPTLVVAKRPKGECFNALPVTLGPQEEHFYRRIHGLDEEDEEGTKPELPDLFLEPKTHRLLTTARAEACLDDLAPVYRNHRNNWVAVRSTSLTLAIPPLELEEGMDPSTYTYQRTTVDLQKGGVYDQHLLKDIESYLQSRNAEMAVLGGMAQQYRKNHQGDSYSSTRQLRLSDFYPDAPSADALDFIMSMNWAWWYLVQYGRVATIILSLHLFYRVSTYLIKVATALCKTPKTPSVFLHVFHAFYPELATYLIEGKYRPNGPRGPCHELVLACVQRRDLRTPEGSDDDVEVIHFRQQKAKRINRRIDRLARRRQQGHLGKAAGDWDEPRYLVATTKKVDEVPLYPQVRREGSQLTVDTPNQSEVAVEGGAACHSDAETVVPNTPGSTEEHVYSQIAPKMSTFGKK